MEEIVHIEDDVSDEDFDSLPPVHNSDEEMEAENISNVPHNDNSAHLLNSTSQQQNNGLNFGRSQHATQQLNSSAINMPPTLPQPMSGSSSLSDADKEKLSAVIDLTHELFKLHTKKKLGVVSTENFGVNLARWHSSITENKLGIDMLMNFLATEIPNFREILTEFDNMRKKPIDRMSQIHLLNAQSLRSVIEQALRNEKRSRCFTKFLFMNNFYVIIARKYNTYCFRMNVFDAHSGANFGFEVKRDLCSTTDFKMSLENARVIADLLKPPAYVISVYTENEGSLKYLELVNRSSGKIDLLCVHHCTKTVKFLKDNWSRIVKLDICASLLKNSRIMPPKHFDSLEITDIASTGQLRRIFSHTADTLILVIAYEFGDDAIEEDESDDDSFEGDSNGEINLSAPKIIKECKIIFLELVDEANAPLAIGTVVNSDLDIKRLIVQSDYDFEGAHEWEPGTTDTIIVEYARIFNQSIVVLQQASCDIIVLDVRFKFYSEANHYKLPMNWLVGLKLNEGLEQINDVTSVDCHVVTDLWMGRNVGNVFANFHGRLKYFYIDPEDFEDFDDDED